ncbi:MAG: nitroreductase family deazaflavin-dependent oxidoreductase [Actinomycetes bacterium]
MPISRADVVTRRGDQYAKELVTALARSVPAQLDGGTTTLVLPTGRGMVTPFDGYLRLEASADDAAGLTEVEDVLTEHLLSLGAPRELAVEWVHPGGRARRFVRARGRVQPAGRHDGGHGHKAAVLPRLARLPASLYRADLGWLLGHRFLLLTHVGRRSGRPHDTVLEVLRYDATTRTAVVISGLGRSSDWYLNLRHGRALRVRIGRESFAPVHRELGPDEAVEVLADYERRNRYVGFVVRVVLSTLVGWRYYGTDEDRRRLVDQLPLVAFTPDLPAPPDPDRLALSP